jgi:hypothetical protein
MRNLIVVGLLFLAGNLIGQTQKVIPDTLVKLGGKKMLVNFKNATLTTIYYSSVEKPKETVKIDKKDVEKIIFKNGRIEIFNQPAFKVLEEGQWETVLITRNKKDIEGLYKRKEVTAQSSPTKSKKKAKENAIIKMQKLTANVGGTIVLITHEETIGGFDENPAYLMEGIAYGTEPLEEGTNVVADPAKKNNQTPANKQQNAPNTDPKGQNKNTQGATQKTTTNPTQQKIGANTTNPVKK